MNSRRISTIFQRLEQQNPAPTTELHYNSPFELLIAVLLSAQATDISVNKATAALFAQAKTPKQMLALGEAGIRDYIKTIGLYNAKARHIWLTCQALVTQHQGQVPSTRAALEALPGVGRKTANVVLNTAFGEPTVAVDTHIFRVARRLGLSTGNTPRAVEEDLLRLIPAKYLANAHHWLILHGRYVCKARKPLCSSCPIQRYCEYPLKEV